MSGYSARNGAGYGAGSSARGGGGGSGAIGAANKADLFTARSQPAATGAAIMNPGSRGPTSAGAGGVGAGFPVPGSSRSQASNDENRLPSNRDRLQNEYNVVAEEDDPLQLEHMLGYSGNFRRTALGLPNRDNYYVKRY
jgi:hypothetical protein